MNFATILGIWIAATLTIAILSFLYRDNPLYKFAEHLYVGASAAYVVITLAKSTMEELLVKPFFQNIALYRTGGVNAANGLAEALILIIPTVLGLLMLTRWFGPKVSWLSRWPIAFAVGLGSGLGITGGIQGFLLPQIQATLLPLWSQGYDLWTIVGNILLFVGVVATLIYFYFSKPHTGFLGGVSRVGIIFIMVSFGAAFGYTVMSRISLLIGRLYFLVNDWAIGTLRVIGIVK
ncbi:hypothetical protein GX441_07935 [bacterium]|nr:hypothetical protein [bacterium]